MVKLSPEQARRLVLISQGLVQGSPFTRGAKGVGQVLEKLSYVQIDTISVVERAHHHVFWSRQPNYRLSDLDQAIEQGQAFEYWSHAAAYLPMRDYRFSLPKKNAIANGEKHWFEKDPKQANFVLDSIRERGPMMAKDFQQNRSIKNLGWGDRKPAKVALEILFMEGKLMIAKRQGFQKVFDLTERVLPSEVNTSTPSEAEFLDHLIERFLSAQGLGLANQIAYLRKDMAKKVEQRARHLLKEGRIVEVDVSGSRYLALEESLASLNKRIDKSKLRILSPFDNLVIQRQRASDLFNFDYLIECYVPAAKRKYGYFVLPIMRGTRFVGRIDAKVDRKSKCLNIISLFEEAGQNLEGLDSALDQFARFNGVNEWTANF